MILRVSYDLKGPVGSRQEIIDVLKGEISWWHYMPATWLVATTCTPQELYEKLKPYVRPGDRVLVAEFTRPFQGWLPRKAWAWIHAHEDDGD